MISVVELDTTKLLTKVDPRYLSVALGMIHKNWEQLDFNNRRVINMASALSPAYVRLGGTGADLAIFDDTAADTNRLKLDRTSICDDLDLKLHKLRKNFTFNREDWKSLNEFTKRVNWTLLFDVNVILKRSDGCWNSSNFRKLLKFSYSLGYNPIAWELGIIYKLR